MKNNKSSKFLRHIILPDSIKRSETPALPLADVTGCIVPGFSKYRNTRIYSAYHPFYGNVGLRALKNYLHRFKLGQFKPIQKIDSGWICDYNNRGDIIGKTWCESYTLCVFSFEDIAINYHIETNDTELINKFQKWVSFNREKFGCNEN